MKKVEDSDGIWVISNNLHSSDLKSILKNDIFFFFKII